MKLLVKKTPTDSITLTEIQELEYILIPIKAKEFKSLPNALCEVEIKNVDERTIQQNRSLHLYCKQMSEELNNAGYTVNFVLARRYNNIVHRIIDWLPINNNIKQKAKNRLDKEMGDGIEWDTIKFKDLIWKPIQKAITGKNSTTKLTKNELTKVYENVNNIMLNRYKIGKPFPNKDLWREND
jgi:hypothetical protein